MKDSVMDPEKLFTQYIPAGKVLGIVGCGSLGEEIRQYALAHGVEVLLCDPPRAALESEEEWENTCELWGNGMGGKLYAKEEFLTFLPLEYLLEKADILSIQIPEGTVLFTEEAVKKIPEDMIILNFSGDGIFAPGTALPDCSLFSLCLHKLQ